MQHYDNNFRNRTQPYAGIVNLLQNLSSNDYKLAVISNKYDTAVNELKDFLFPGIFKPLPSAKAMI